MRKINTYIFVTLFFASMLSIKGCATDDTYLKIENSLPQSEITYYNDSFDKLREDLWDKASLVFKETQMDNLKLADIRIENGKLVVETKTGGFSKGGLGSKFALRGDFNIQIECHIEFLKGQHDMDQLISFLVVDQTKGIQEMYAVVIGLIKKGQGFIYSGHFNKGKYHRGNHYQTSNFHGALRIVRIDGKISTLFKRDGEKRWKKLDTFKNTTKDVMLAFKLDNFLSTRTSIKAKSSITATFDNFKINAAQKIIEEEI